MDSDRNTEPATRRLHADRPLGGIDFLQNLTEQRTHAGLGPLEDAVHGPVHQFAGFAGHAESPFAKPGTDVLGSRADKGDLEVMDGPGTNQSHGE